MPDASGFSHALRAAADSAELIRADSADTRHTQAEAQFRGVDPRTRRALIVWATETPVLHESGRMVSFGLSDDLCDLSLLRSGRAPLLMEHHQNVQSVLGVIEAAWVEETPAGREGLCVARFSRRPAAVEVFEDIVDGIVTGASTGFMLTGMLPPATTGGPDIGRSQPYEVSICALGRNPNAGARRVPTVEEQRAGLDGLVRLVRLEEMEAAELRARRELRAEAWEAWAEQTARTVAEATGASVADVAAMMQTAVSRQLDDLAQCYRLPPAATPPTLMDLSGE